MKKEIYDKVATTSVLLSSKLDELMACQKEKEEILSLIDQLTEEGILEQNEDIIREKMNNNIKRFKKVVDELNRLNKKI